MKTQPNFTVHIEKSAFLWIGDLDHHFLATTQTERIKDDRSGVVRESNVRRDISFANFDEIDRFRSNHKIDFLSHGERRILLV